MTSSIIETATIAVKYALNIGASEAEAFIVKSRNNSVEMENNTIKLAHSSEDKGLGIRVLIGRKIGFSYTNKLDKNSIERTVEKALSIARSGKEDPYMKGLPSPSANYPRVEGTYSIELARIGLDNLVEKASRMLEILTHDKRIVVVWGSVTTSTWSVAIANSNGIYQLDHGTVAFIGAEVVARENADVTPGISEWEISRTSLPAIEKIALRLREKAISNLNPVKIDEGSLPVILTEYAVNSLFTYTFIEAIKGDNVVRGKSPYRDKLESKVASENITIVDDGLLKNGLNTSIFDGEGIPRRKTTIIEKGVLKNFIYDHYWGVRAGKESTGNASRNDYASMPRIAPSNLVILPGDYDKNELIKETKKGLLIDGFQGAHSSNPETGEFSVVATPAWYVENGELRAVRGVMIAGNLYELLEKVDALTRTSRQVGVIKTPWIRFPGVRVIVKK